MKLALKDYQEEAVVKILQGLRRASRDYEEGREYGSVSLSAPTGSGKTVIAAAVIEQILFGDSEGDVGADANAVFLWLTDDPSLNQQTRKKILEASERIQPGHLVTVDDAYDRPEFEHGKVYFLNIQRLARSSNLVKPAEGRRRFAIWETIRRTIENNGSHYYLVRDEAHRGARGRSADQRTIAQRLVSGETGVVPATPVVLGISATPERFDEEMAAALPVRVSRRVSVPIEQVKESGLIKDVLSIHHKGEAETMEMTLVREAIRNLRDFDAAWNDYSEKEGEPAVRPVMVVQIPPDSDDVVAGILDVCKDEWPILQGNAVAHSLQSHTAEAFGSHTVHYVQPQDIQDHPTVRLVIFKEALTTGWDCPRAEVMVSLRKARDDTYIAQLIGRMVRAPLARRIESNESLNRVLLYLPHFDQGAVRDVKNKLERDPEGPPTEIVINSVEAIRNKSVPSTAFELFESLTSYVVPGLVHRSQITRLHRLAALLVGDGLLANAIATSDAFLVGVLEEEKVRLEADGVLAGVIDDVATASYTVTEMAMYADGDATEVDFLDLDTELADVDRMFKAAARSLRDGLADTYWGNRVTVHGDDAFDAKVLTIALARDSGVVERVEHEAGERVAQWLDTYGDEISRMSEDKKAKYADIRAMARAPEVVHPGLPAVITMPGDETVPRYDHHLFADRKGGYRTRLGDWEAHVFSVEAARMGFVAWYRNPTGGQRSLRIPFRKGGIDFGKLYPDFVFFHEDGSGDLRASIVDPHGHYLADAGPKLRGLAAYADAHGSEYERVVAVIKAASGEFRMLDLTEEDVREHLTDVATQEEIEAVFHDHGAIYGS